MAEESSAMSDRLLSTEGDDAILLDDLDDSFETELGTAHRGSNEGRSLSLQESAGLGDSRTNSISDNILGEMSSFLVESPFEETRRIDGGNLSARRDEEQETSHEDILDVRAGVDTTLDDQFEVLDSAEDQTDHVGARERRSTGLSQDKTVMNEKVRRHSDEEEERDDQGGRNMDSDKEKMLSDSGSHKIVDKLFLNTRYFVMKSNNYENIEIAKSKSVWSTPPYNEKKLNKSHRECKNVLLIFSVKESGRFQGFARLASDSRRDVPMPPWVLPGTISIEQLGGVFKLDWIHRGELEFSHTLDLKNPWNDNKPVKISRDGQEVEPAIGEALCRLWSGVSESSGGGGLSTNSNSAAHIKFASRLGSAPRSGSGGHHHMTSSSSSQPGLSSRQLSHHHHHHLAPQPLYTAQYVHPATFHMQAALMAQQQQRSGMLGHMMGGYGHHQGYGGAANTSQPNSKQKGSGEDGASGDGRKRRSDDRDRDRDRPHSSRYESSGRSSGHSRGSNDGGGGGGHGRRERHRSRSRERDTRRGRPEHRSSGRHVRERRSASRSDSSMEEEYGVRKETLLHGSYDEYLKEYRSRGGKGNTAGGSGPSKSTGGLTTDRITTICQQALAQALQQTTAKPMDQQAYGKMVERFLSKTRSGEKIGGGSS